MIEKLMNAFDEQQPDWWITYAHQQDLIDYTRMTSDKHSGTVKAELQLRQRTADRLIMPIRAAVHAGLLKEVAPTE